MLSLCACNEKFTVAHALHSPKGGYTHMRNNEFRDSFANLLSDVCLDVEINPHLHLLKGETFALKSTIIDCARSDIKARGLWDSMFNEPILI